MGVEETESSKPEIAPEGDDLGAPEPGPGVPEAPRPDRSRAIGLGTIAGLVAVGIGLIVLSPRRATTPVLPGDSPPSLALTNAELTTDAGALLPVASALHVQADAAPPAAAAPVPRPPPAWRVASLRVDGSLDVVEGTFGKKGLVQSLLQAGLPRPEIKRVAHAFENVRRLEHPAPTDGFVLAKDKAKGTVTAFELTGAPTDVWQTRLDDAGELRSAKKLELFVEHKGIASALVVGSDLAKSIVSAGLRPEVVDAVDDALDGHVEGSSLRGGARIRFAATEDWVEGAFARIRVDAVEFVPAGGGSPLRVYHYERDASVSGSHRRAPAAGFYDAKGKQPFRGAFRSPLSLARVTSRFNPKRMHPVLHVVMPHNGVDFGATTGTPVYAAGAGTVRAAGNGGPCGNMVEIEHSGGITTVYCHLKGFAQGLHAGQKVEPRQLIAYVGQTGRVTGPHLHFGVKKNGVFVDPLGLKMDGVRVLPPADRDAFAKKREGLDGLLDAVALPPAGEHDEPQETTDESDEGDVHPE